MSILLICILWTWGLTPIWVNVIGTIIMSLRIMFSVGKLIVLTADKAEEDDIYEQYK